MVQIFVYKIKNFQGFTDSEEFVAKKALNAMTQLIEKRLLQKTALFQLISDIPCFLIHPNLWIRQVCLTLYISLLFYFNYIVTFLRK